ncbi:MAG: type II toxin-antitoxin system death-on-curing family toxin [Oscillatoria princeps RMCB-10]|nr:type II toxin-antitoxin system death-on-curing family toxin [Oscillatoria princeps RMCB-10]
MQTPKFLSKSLVLALHQDMINEFGGLSGVRDEGLLDSALAQPQATFAQQLLHQTLQDQAAAYLFHISRNHPFLDGNKRTACAAMETFVELNGCRLDLSDEEEYELVLRVAQGELTKEEIANFLEQHLRCEPF